MDINDNDPATITMPREQAEALVAAGNLVSELWGDLAAGDAITLGGFDERLEAAGLAGNYDGVTMLSPVLTDAVVDVAVALGRADGEAADGLASWEDDVDAAEASFAGEIDAEDEDEAAEGRPVDDLAPA